MLERPRATGYYAIFAGREYHATVNGANVILRSYDGEPAVVDFSASQVPSIQGVRIVQRSQIEKLTYVRTVCRWRGEPFLVTAVYALWLGVFYIGNRGEWMASQPGMVRTGKLEVHGSIDRSVLEEIIEFVDPLG